MGDNRPTASIRKFPVNPSLPYHLLIVDGNERDEEEETTLWGFGQIWLLLQSSF